MRLITVFGASGRQGLAQVRQLVNAGFAVRAISRSADPFYGETFENTTVMAADLDDAESVARAVAGVDGVFLNCPLMTSRHAVDRIERVGRLAHKANVPRVVLHVPLWLPDEPVNEPGYDNGRLEASTMLESHPAATVFGGVIFMDNMLTDWAFPGIVTRGEYRYPHNPELECNWISLDDIAKFMVAALDRPDLIGRKFSLGGPERLKPPQVAAILSDVLGRTIRYIPLTPREYGVKLADSFGLMPGPERDATIRTFEDFYIFNNFSPLKPFAVDMTETLKLIPIGMETLKEWASRQEWEVNDKKRPPAG
jgi:uncharacterized protein YbjT (DUF2867 family)